MNHSFPVKYHGDVQNRRERRTAVSTICFALVLLVGGCGGDPPPELTVGPTLLTVDHTLGQTDSSTGFSITNTGGGTLTWRISQQPNFVTSVSPSSGTLLSTESASLRAVLSCTQPGTQSGRFTVVGDDNQSQSVTLNFTCTAPPIKLAVSSALSAGTGTPLVATTDQLGWSFSSTWDNQGSVQYSISTDDSRLSLTPSQGTVAADIEVLVDLTFQCDAVEDLTPTLTLTAEGVSMEVPWQIACLHPPVDLKIDALANAEGTPLVQANSTLVWHFESEWEDHIDEQYRISTDSSNVALSLIEGTVAHAASVDIPLVFNCPTVSEFKAVITIEIRGFAVEQDWNVTCHAPPVTIQVSSVELTQTGILPTPAVGSLAWSFSSEWEDHGVESYEIKARNPLFSAFSQSGTANPNEIVNHQLTFACVRPEIQSVLLSIVVGDESANLTWDVVCDAPPIRVVAGRLNNSVALVGNTATTKLNWSFASVWQGQEDLNYSVVASDVGLSIGGSTTTGTVSLDSRLTHNLSYQCESAAQLDLVITISVGSATQRDIPWTIFCSDLTVELEVASSALVPWQEKGEGQLNWSFTLSPDPKVSLSYSLTTNNENLTVTPRTGKGSSAIEYESVLVYQCSTAGTFNLPITLELLGSTKETTWRVICSPPPIDITHLPPRSSTAYIGESASSSFTWSFSSTVSSPGAETFRISSNSARASVSPNSGTSRADVSNRHTTTFACRSEGSFRPVFTLLISGIRTQLPWTVDCLVVPPVAVIINSISSSSAVIGDSISGTVTWRYTAVTGSPTLSYVVTTSPRVSANPQRGTATKGVPQTIRLSRSCSSADRDTITVSISAGGVTESRPWQIECRTAPPISISISGAGTQSAGTTSVNAVQDFSWQLASAPDPQTSYSYNVTVSNSKASVNRRTGTVKQGGRVVTQLRYNCTIPENVTVNWSITINSVTESSNWRVTCVDAPSNVIFIDSVEFYQGLMVANYQRLGGGIHATYRKSEYASLSRTRPLYLGVEIHTESAPPHPVNLKSLGDLQVTARIGNQPASTLTRDSYSYRYSPSNSKSGYWESVLFFRITDSYIDSNAVIAVEMLDGSSDGSQVPEIFLSSHDIVTLPTVRVKFYRFKSNIGTPSTPSQSTVATYINSVNRLLPMGKISGSASTTPIVGQTLNISQGDNECEYLSKLYNEWALHGSENDYYYGLYFFSPSRTLGCAIIGGHVGVGVPDEYRTFAHEIGHNFELLHAPCGHVSSYDHKFPYSDGGIGPNRGFDIVAKELVQPTDHFSDIMTYCTPSFIAPYHYDKAMKWATRNDGNLTNSLFSGSAKRLETVRDASEQDQQTYRSLAVTGRVSEGEWTVEMVRLSKREPFHYRYYQSIQRPDQYLLQITDESGFDLSPTLIEPKVAAHAWKDLRFWATRIPIPDRQPESMQIFDSNRQVMLHSQVQLDERVEVIKTLESN